MALDNKIGQRVLEIVRRKGPLVPSQVSVEIGTSSLLASAILSELASNSHVRISSVKVGGSPLYYAPGQEEKLQGYTKYLHEKERKAYDLLKTKLVLQDDILDPVTRVALRQIKDFAKPLNVQANDGVKLFWKWYLLSNEESEPYIKKLLEGEKKVETVQAPVAEKQQALKVQKKEKTPSKPASEFVNAVMEYFSKNNIEVLERFESKKRTETDLIVSVPSPVGSIKYYCKAKNKKSCNDADLSTAYVQGQSRKMPVLFLTSGKLTKKAMEMLGKEFSSINVKQI